jgi:hypothetical protein
VLIESLAVRRGDIVQTNVGDKRERTWIVLRARRARRGFNVWAARWWELEPEMRVRLASSAIRNGGQSVHYYKPDRKQKKRTFEDYMRRREGDWFASGGSEGEALRHAAQQPAPSA